MFRQCQGIPTPEDETINRVSSGPRHSISGDRPNATTSTSVLNLGSKIFPVIIYKHEVATNSISQTCSLYKRDDLLKEIQQAPERKIDPNRTNIHSYICAC